MFEFHLDRLNHSSLSLFPFGSDSYPLLHFKTCVCDMETEASVKIKGEKKGGDLGVNERVLSLTENGQLLILSVNLLSFKHIFLCLQISACTSFPSSTSWFPPPMLSRLPSFHYSLKLRHMWDTTQPVRGAHQGELAEDRTRPKGWLLLQVDLPINTISRYI